MPSRPRSATVAPEMGFSPVLAHERLQQPVSADLTADLTKHFPAGLLTGASAWRGPDAAPFMKTPAVQAGDQGGPLRGRQNGGGRAALSGRRQQQGRGRPRFTQASNLTDVL